MTGRDELIRAASLALRLHAGREPLRIIRRLGSVPG
jgi:hypothetical protein